MVNERMFFALWPPAAVRDALLAVRAGLPGAAGRENHPLDLHLTLVFVGAVDPERRPCVEAAGDGLALPGFELSLDESGDWPRAGIRWCRPGTFPATLPALVQALQARLRACGISPEPRPFRPHVTLARKAAATPRNPLPAPVPWSVREFVLAASLAGRRPAYQVLRRWPLT